MLAVSAGFLNSVSMKMIALSVSNNSCFVVNIWQYSQKYDICEILVSLAAQCVEKFIRETDIADKGIYLLCHACSEADISKR